MKALRKSISFSQSEHAAITAEAARVGMSAAALIMRLVDAIPAPAPAPPPRPATKNERERGRNPDGLDCRTINDRQSRAAIARRLAKSRGPMPPGPRDGSDDATRSELPRERVPVSRGKIGGSW